MPDSDRPNSLPYRDTKPVGAAGFFFAINATFRFIERQLGPEALRRYWTDLGRDYGHRVSEDWKKGGLPAVAAYWRDFFAAEPGAEVEVSESDQVVTLEVSTCPAIRFLRQEGREIIPCFCQHCYYQGEAMAKAAGLTMRLSGGNGRCQHRFQPIHADVPEQDLAAIEEAKC